MEEEEVREKKSVLALCCTVMCAKKSSMCARRRVSHMLEKKNRFVYAGIYWDIRLNYWGCFLIFGESRMRGVGPVSRILLASG